MRRKQGRRSSPLFPKCSFMIADEVVVDPPPGVRIAGYWERNEVCVVMRTRARENGHQITVRRPNGIFLKVPSEALRQNTIGADDLQEIVAQKATKTVNLVFEGADEDAWRLACEEAIIERKREIGLLRKSVRTIVTAAAPKTSSSAKGKKGTERRYTQKKETNGDTNKKTKALERAMRACGMNCGSATAAKKHRADLETMRAALRTEISLEWPLLGKKEKKERIARGLSLTGVTTSEAALRSRSTRSALAKIKFGFNHFEKISTKGGPKPDLPAHLIRTVLCLAQGGSVATGGLTNPKLLALFKDLYKILHGKARSRPFCSSWLHVQKKNNADLNLRQKKQVTVEKRRRAAATPETVLAHYKTFQQVFKSLEYEGRSLDCAAGIPRIPASHLWFWDEVSMTVSDDGLRVLSGPQSTPHTTRPTGKFHITLLVGGSVAGHQLPGVIIIEGKELPPTGVFNGAISQSGDWTVIFNDTGSMRSAGIKNNGEWDWGTMMAVTDHFMQCRALLKIPPDEVILHILDQHVSHLCKLAQSRLLLANHLLIHGASDATSILQIGDDVMLNWILQKVRRELYGDAEHELGGITPSNCVQMLMLATNRAFGLHANRKAGRNKGFNITQHGGKEVSDCYVSLFDEDIERAVQKHASSYEKGLLLQGESSIDLTQSDDEKKLRRKERADELVKLHQVNRRLRADGLPPLPDWATTGIMDVNQILRDCYIYEQQQLHHNKRKRNAKTTTHKIKKMRLRPEDRRGAGPCELVLSSKKLEHASSSLRFESEAREALQAKTKEKLVALEDFLGYNFAVTLTGSVPSRFHRQICERAVGTKGNIVAAASLLAKEHAVAKAFRQPQLGGNRKTFEGRLRFYTEAAESIPQIAAIRDPQSARRILETESSDCATATFARACNEVIHSRVKAVFEKNVYDKLWKRAHRKGWIDVWPAAFLHPSPPSMPATPSITTPSTTYIADDNLDNAFARANACPKGVVFMDLLQSDEEGDDPDNDVAHIPTLQSLLDDRNVEQAEHLQVARYLLHELRLPIYGGFIRSIVAGERINDIDVDASNANANVFAEKLFARFGKLQRMQKGKNVLECTTLGGVKVEFVDCDAFAKANPYPADVDVNNLQITKHEGLRRKGRSKSLPSLSQTLRNMMNRHFVPIEPPCRIPHRIHRLETRGWKMIGTAKEKYAVYHSMQVTRKALTGRLSSLGANIAACFSSDLWNVIRDDASDSTAATATAQQRQRKHSSDSKSTAATAKAQQRRKRETRRSKAQELRTAATAKAQQRQQKHSSDSKSTAAAQKGNTPIQSARTAFSLRGSLLSRANTENSHQP